MLIRIFSVMVILSWSLLESFFVYALEEDLPIESLPQESSENIGTQSLQISIQKGTFLPQRLLSLRQPIEMPSTALDTSFLRYVSPDHPLESIDYRPSDLVPLSQIPEINQAGRSSLYRDAITQPLQSLARAFHQEFSEPLIVVSAFRSAEYQQRLWDLGRCNDGHFCSKPGHSEHQLGIAFDFFDASSETIFMSNPRYRRQVEWLQNNAHRYGFTQSYQYGPLIDNYEVEPWHWRYVGVDMATHLHELGWSYTRYLKMIDAVMAY